MRLSVLDVALLRCICTHSDQAGGAADAAYTSGVSGICTQRTWLLQRRPTSCYHLQTAAWGWTTVASVDGMSHPYGP